ncbi:MFS transporter [Neobacillus sp. SM06]|uniref:MFS transporter n=1 Tax=Neobacillus sp. SM06 TaxID=3422492 RepID=UPI003D2A690B
MGFAAFANNEQSNSHWYAVATVCIGAFMAALDASIINIALPKLQQQFNTPMNEIEWVSLAYLLSLASLILIFGRLADMIGRRWLYIIGFVLFSVSSLFCGLAPSLSVLVVARVLQGMGAALLQANSVSIITSATPKRDLGKAIGFQASAQGIGLSLGPVVGGALLSFVSWKWLFFINLPIGIIGIVLGILFLPKDAVQVQNGKTKFDFAGAIFLIPSLITIIYILNMGLKLGWTSPVMIGSFAVAVVCSYLFIRIESKRAEPLVDLSLFKHSFFTFGNITGILSFMVMYAVLLLTPYYLDQVKHLPIFQASFLITVIPIGMTIATPISGMITDRRGPAAPLLLGLSMTTVGSLLLTFIDITGTYVITSIGLFLVGSGIGMFTPPNNSSIMGSVPKNVLGITGGILNMSRTLGMGLGVTFGGLMYQFFSNMYGSSPLEQLLLTFRSSYLLIAIFSLLTLLITFKNCKREFKHND